MRESRQSSYRKTGRAVAGFAGIALIPAQTRLKSSCLWDDCWEPHQPKGVRGFQRPCEFGVWGCTWPGVQLYLQTMYSAVVKSRNSPELALEDAFQHPKTAVLGFPFLPGWAPGRAPGKAHTFASDYRALGDKPSIVPWFTRDSLFTLDPFQLPYRCSSGLSLSLTCFIWEVSGGEEEGFFVMGD